MIWLSLSLLIGGLIVVFTFVGSERTSRLFAAAVLIFWAPLLFIWIVRQLMGLAKAAGLGSYMNQVNPDSQKNFIGWVDEAMDKTGASSEIRLEAAKVAMRTAEDVYMELKERIGDPEDFLVAKAKMAMNSARAKHIEAWVVDHNKLRKVWTRKLEAFRQSPKFRKIADFILKKFPGLVARFAATKLGFKELKAGLTAAAKEYMKRNT